MPPDSEAPPPLLPATLVAGIGQKLRDEPGLALTLGYLALTGIGLTYQWALFVNFKVNILDWADFTDFVLAALREPVAILLAVAAAGVLLAVRQFDRWQQRQTWYRRYRARFESTPRQLLVRSISVILLVPTYFWVFTAAYATSIAQRIQAGEGKAVTIEYATSVPPAARPASDERPLWIGSTSRAVFLWSPRSRETLVVPTASIARLRVGLPPKKSATRGGS